MLTLTARRLLLAVVAASLLIAAIDTAFAQYVSNIRVLKLTDYLTAFYDGRPEVPPPKTDKPRTWIEGLGHRADLSQSWKHRGD